MIATRNPFLLPPRCVRELTVRMFAQLLASLLTLAFVAYLVEWRHPEACMRLSPADTRTAYWFLANGAIFNSFLDVGSGALQVLLAAASH